MGLKKKFVLLFISLFIIVSCQTTTSFYKDHRVEKVNDYLYELVFDDYSYDYAMRYIANNYKYDGGGCSVVRNGNFFGRNFDWYYDDSVEFLIRVNGTVERHASIGIAGSLSDLTADFVRSGKNSPLLNALPYFTLDGINDSGVVCSISVVPNSDAKPTTGTNPKAGKRDIYAPMIVRYVLDNASSAAEAVDMLSDMNVICAISPENNQNFHFMIADNYNTFVVEFINNEMEVLRDTVKVMTNFYLSSILSNTAMGKERHDLLSMNYRLGSSKRGMLNLMKMVYYTRSYDISTYPFWFSEYSTQWGYFANPEIRSSYRRGAEEDDYYELVRGFRFNLQPRVRSSSKDHKNAFWQTTHLSVYDIHEKKLTLIVQEDNKEYEYVLNYF